MKRIATFLLTLLLCAGVSAPAYSQGFLKKLAQKIDKATESLDKLGNSSSGQGKGAGEKNNPKSDRAKFNLVGEVMTIVEQEVEKQLENYYKFDNYGMLYLFECTDNSPSSSDYSYSGSMEWVYNYQSDDNPAGCLQKSSVSLKDQLDFNGKSYREPERMQYSWNDDYLPTEAYDNYNKRKTIYTYDQNKRLVKTEAAGSVINYVYDANGRVSEIHLGEISDYPSEKFAYDAQGRVSRHDTPGMVMEYTYNKRGDWASRSYRITEGEEGEGLESYTYTYDTTGNWTERIGKNSAGEVTATIKRSITYRR